VLLSRRKTVDLMVSKLDLLHADGCGLHPAAIQ
jgi:hypothetical protein